MSRITVIGGHGKVALRLIPRLVAGGHEVTAWVRNRDHEAEVAGLGATVEVADAELLDVPAMTALLHGQDAVVWSAGAGGGNPHRTFAVDRDAAIRSMQAAMHAQARRFVMVSYFGAGPEHGVPEGDSFRAYADAKAAADTHLHGTDLDWTIVGPSGLTDEPGTGRITVGDPRGSRTVSRDDVAAVIAAVIADESTIGRTIEFNTGETPIAEAIHLG